MNHEPLGVVLSEWCKCEREIPSSRPAEADPSPWARHFCSRECAAAACDNTVVRVRRNASELWRLIAREGLRFGVMPPAEAFDYLHEAELLIAGVRRSLEGSR